MFCSKCGMQNPDGSAFCSGCGASFEGDVSAASQPFQQVPPMQQPMNQVPPMQQPQQFPGQPMPGQPMPGQPMPGQPMPNGAQPAYAAPYYGAPAKKSKTVPIVLGIAGALVVAFLIVLFTVIIPKSSSGKNSINHVWSLVEDGQEIIMDFKNNEFRIETPFEMTFPIKWSVDGDVITVITYSPFDNSKEMATEKSKFSISSDGRVLTLTSIDGSSSVQTLTRKD